MGGWTVSAPVGDGEVPDPPPPSPDCAQFSSTPSGPGFTTSVALRHVHVSFGEVPCPKLRPFCLYRLSQKAWHPPPFAAPCGSGRCWGDRVFGPAKRILPTFHPPETGKETSAYTQKCQSAHLLGLYGRPKPHSCGGDIGLWNTLESSPRTPNSPVIVDVQPPSLWSACR